MTARYVSEFRAAQHPRLSEYLSRYPHYANMIADFVTYYHAIEVDVPQESEIIPPLSQTSRAAFDEAWKHVVYADSGVNNTLNSLQVAADSVNKSFLQVALEIGLSQDILQKLDLHVCSFLEAVEQSNNMSDEQKGVWHAILVHEGLL